jgi:hypothetical protein
VKIKQSNSSIKAAFTLATYLGKNICDSDCTSLLMSNNIIRIRLAAQNKPNLLVKIFCRLNLAAGAIVTWLTLTVANALEIVN